MRRILLFAAFLLLLGLSTATAASFDVQAEDITSFTTDVSISVPPPPVPVGTELYLIDAPQHAALTAAEPVEGGGNHTARFEPSSGPMETEADAGSNPGYPYVVWSLLRPAGMQFTNQTARVHFTRTNGSATLTAAIFECSEGAAPQTVVGSECILLGQGTSAPDASTEIDIPLDDDSVRPGFEIRLKMLNGSSGRASIQWGYKAQNRPARIEFLAGSPAA